MPRAAVVLIGAVCAMAGLVVCVSLLLPTRRVEWVWWGAGLLLVAMLIGEAGAVEITRDSNEAFAAHALTGRPASPGPVRADADEPPLVAKRSSAPRMPAWRYSASAAASTRCGFAEQRPVVVHTTPDPHMPGPLVAPGRAYQTRPRSRGWHHRVLAHHTGRSSATTRAVAPATARRRNCPERLTARRHRGAWRPGATQLISSV